MATYTFTAEDIKRERDEHGLSWRQVATNLDLTNPGQARKAYSELVGDYRDSKPTIKRDTASVGELGTAKVRKSKIDRPEWDDESDQEDIEDKLTRAKIVVERDVRGHTVTEELTTGRVHAFSFEPVLTVHVSDAVSGGRRSFRVADIKSVKR